MFVKNKIEWIFILNIYFWNQSFYVVCFCFLLDVIAVIRVIRHHRHHYLMSLFLIYGCVHSTSFPPSKKTKLKPQIRKHSDIKSIQVTAWLRFAHKPIAFHGVFNWRSNRKYFVQFYSDNNYAVYEWTYIDTHVNLCINILEGFLLEHTVLWPNFMYFYRLIELQFDTIRFFFLLVLFSLFSNAFDPCPLSLKLVQLHLMWCVRNNFSLDIVIYFQFISSFSLNWWFGILPLLFLRHRCCYYYASHITPRDIIMW